MSYSQKAQKAHDAMKAAGEEVGELGLAELKEDH